MDSIALLENSQKVMEQIRKGAFLTVKRNEAINTMTIGWATIGIIWQKPILMVAVRPTRHTFGIIDVIDNFTVSVPFNSLQKELSFCGTKSGRDCDKIKECGLTLVNAHKVGSPVIKVSGIQIECSIVYKSVMNPQNLVDGYQKHYPHKDYHTLYFGEVLDCYRITE